MSDELERLEAAMRANVPQPPAEARNRTIAASMAAFDEHRESIHDGAPAKAGREKGFRSWLAGFTRPSSHTHWALAGAAGLALVATLAVYLTQAVFLGQVSDDEVRPAQPAKEPPSVDFSVWSPPAETEDGVFPDSSPGRPIVGQDAPGAEFEPLGLPAELRQQSAPTISVPPMDNAEDPAYRDQGRDRFAPFDANPIKVAAEEPVSTFSIDVDTASYGFTRAALRNGVLPEKNAVRIEELVNYFPYDYPSPEHGEMPFATTLALLPAPWRPANRLLHIGIKGFVPEAGPTRRANLVFLIDTSGSMDAPNKLPLVVNSLKLLLGTLAADDRVAIVTYAGTAGVALEPTRVGEAGKIEASLERLDAQGATAGAEGIRQAYLLAAQHFASDGINRVILATDGDFNVGITDPEALLSYVERKREGGVWLSVLGFGMGNYNDALMQRLAQNGNGNALYIDTLSEARKALVDEATSLLFPIAKDVKIQVEFNPAEISEYRLVGYETRLLAGEDFRNDKVDAGEIGAGHAVTAIYEVTPAGSGAERIAPLRYRRDETASNDGPEGELAFLKIRYKLPGGDTSDLIERAITSDDVHETVSAAPDDVRFAVAVAAFGQVLRGGIHTGDYGYADVIALARDARGDDPYGYRAEFISLVRLAETASAMEALRQ